MARTALKVVEKPPFYTRELELWPGGRKRDSHSLHYSVSYPSSYLPEIPAHFIELYSSKGDVVLDPFCGCGTTALEACLQGRVSFASDVSPLALKMTRAKLVPADLTQLTLQLQILNLRRPVSSSQYKEFFSEFYDIDTFRELMNLRQHCLDNQDPVNRFIQLISLSLLHGHTAGFFSGYTFPQISLSPEEQRKLNIKRSQSPGYRAIIPRILKRAALALRDGIPSVLTRSARHSRVAHRDARDLSYIEGPLVDLVVTAPPLPGEKFDHSKLWLKGWFANVPQNSYDHLVANTADIQEWSEFMNEVLFELARVVKSGGRVVLDLRKIRVGRSNVCLAETLLDLVEKELCRYWEGDSLQLVCERETKVKNYSSSSKAGQNNVGQRPGQSRLLVLRRR